MEADKFGFEFQALKSGRVRIFRAGLEIVALGPSVGAKFLAEIERAGNEVERQLIMAKLTGKYKHGNERLASSHPRNKR